jgi:hypothetical protein
MIRATSSCQLMCSDTRPWKHVELKYFFANCQNICTHRESNPNKCTCNLELVFWTVNFDIYVTLWTKICGCATFEFQPVYLLHWTCIAVTLPECRLMYIRTGYGQTSTLPRPLNNNVDNSVLKNQHFVKYSRNSKLFLNFQTDYWVHKILSMDARGNQINPVDTSQHFSSSCILILFSGVR